MEHPLSDVIAALNGLDDTPAYDLPAAHARPDFGREHRKRVPEVILASGKSPEQVVGIVRAFLDRSGRAIVSRVEPELADRLVREFSDATIEPHPIARMLILRKGRQRPANGGRVGIIAAGTSDLPVAQEAALMAEEMGCQVIMVSDVGVAGLHRLFQPLHQMHQDEVDVIVVAAGMDGALPSVVAGLVDVPVIGLPTSTGYGLGGKGVAALLTMLQSCAPGLSVVNIDNGIGAGASAALIANRVSRLRVNAESHDSTAETVEQRT